VVEAPGFELVRNGIFKVYRNLEAYPRAWVEGSGGAIEKDAAHITAYSWDRVEADASGPGKLIVSDTYFPGWKCKIDGNEIKMTVEENLFRAVRIGPGGHKADIRYQPWAFRIGLWASIAGMAAMIGIFVLRRKNT
jgi:uncharacterized membrane protein YfhO